MAEAMREQGPSPQAPFGGFFDAGELVGVEELSQRMELPRAWIKREAKEGRLPFIRIGGKMKFNLDAVRRVILARASTFPAEPAKKAKQ